VSQGDGGSTKQKISPQFAARLSRLRPQERVRAVVLLRTAPSGNIRAGRQSGRTRKAAIEAVRKSTTPALPDIDKVLKRHDGQRLATQPDALGTIPVETTPAGISALAASEHVKAILEDQPISLLSNR